MHIVPDTRLVLSLVVLVLSVGRASVAADPSRWEKDIAAFESADRSTPPVRGGVMLYGSSSFRLWTNVAEAFPEVTLPLVNRGFGGSHLSDLNAFFDRVVVPHAPRVLLIYGGDNDIAANKPAEQVFADFKELVGRVREHLPRTRVAFVAIKPSPSRENLLGIQQEANALVRQFSRRQRRVDFLDTATLLLDAGGKPDPKWFQSDRLHLNADGYRQWRGVLGPYLRRWAR